MKADESNEAPDSSQSESKSKFDAKSLLKSDFNFEALGEKLAEYCKGYSEPKTPTTQVLDRIKQPLDKAVEAGMSLPQIHLFLVNHGLRVSKPTLRAYLFKTRGKKRAKTMGKARSIPRNTTSEQPTDNQPSPSESKKATPPRVRGA